VQKLVFHILDKEDSEGKPRHRRDSLRISGFACHAL
jgi:hypothetical protein